MEYLPSEFFSINRYIVQTNGFDILKHGVLGSVLKSAVRNSNAGNWRRPIAAQENGVLTLLTSDVCDIDIANDGPKRAAFAFLVIEINFDSGFGDLADGDIAEADVFDDPTAIRIRFNA